MKPMDILSLYHLNPTGQNSKSMQFEEDRQHLRNKLIHPLSSQGIKAQKI